MFCWTISLRGPDGSCQAAVTVGDKLYSFGGDGGRSAHLDISSQTCVYILNTVALHWVKLPPVTTGRRGERPPEVPNMRAGHSAVLVEDIVYIWGNEFTHGNQLYAFNVDAHRWLKMEVSGTVPEERSHHSACVLEKVMYVHGGLLATQWPESNNDTYRLDTTSMVWSLIITRGAPPPASSQHSATVIGTKMFVFGGCGVHFVFWLHNPPVRYCNDIRVFDTEIDCWLSLTPSTQLLPAQRSSHAAFAYDGELYIFGGHNYETVSDSVRTSTFKDLWKFNTKTFSWKKAEPKGKGPSKTSGTHCCMLGDRVFLFCRDPFILDLSPSLRTLCKLAVVQYRLDQSELPQDVRWELAATPSNLRWEMSEDGNWQQVGRVRELAAARNWQ